MTAVLFFAAAIALRIDALPWGTVTSVVNDGGREMLNAPQEAPVVLTLEPGRYRISARGPRGGAKKIHYVVLSAGKESRSLFDFGAVDALRYLARTGALNSRTDLWKYSRAKLPVQGNLEAGMFDDVTRLVVAANALVRLGSLIDIHRITTDVSRPREELHRLIFNFPRKPPQTYADLMRLQYLLDKNISSLEQGLLRQERFLIGVRPPELFTGAVRYFSGEYEAALADLDRHDSKARYWGSEDHLLTSASLFALSRLDRAREEARAARSIDPTLSPARDQFPPRFVRFFRDAQH